MGNEALLCFFIKIIERLAAGLDVLLQIVIGAISHTFQFLPPEWKIVLDVVSAFRIKCALFVGNLVSVQLCPRNADVLIKFQPLLKPVIQPFDPLLLAAKIFQLHLLELARAKREIARINFVPKRFADLRDAERQLLARNFQHVLELHENGLRGLRAKVSDTRFILGRADEGLEHQVECARRC